MTLAELYNYQTPIEAGIAAALEDQFTVWTPLRDPEFQKERPRIEAMVGEAQSLGFLRPEYGQPARSGFMREKARRAVVSFVCITEPNITAHRNFVSQLRGRLDTLGRELNAEGAMDYYTVQKLLVTGGSFSADYDQGQYVTTINCDCDFSVREEEWSSLET